jgi:hypothetical protein
MRKGRSYIRGSAPDSMSHTRADIREWLGARLHDSQRPIGGVVRSAVPAKRVNLLVLGAWALHLAAWFLTVVKAEDMRGAIPGWRAFRLAACGVWPCEGVEFQGKIYAVLATISVLTTLFFILCSPWVVLWGSRTVRKCSAWFAAAAFVFNAHWIVIFGDQRSLLTTGYFLWWLSFLLLAVGLFRLPGAKLTRASGQPSSA